MKLSSLMRRIEPFIYAGAGPEPELAPLASLIADVQNLQGGRRRGSARELPFVTRPPHNATTKPNANGPCCGCGGRHYRHPPPATPFAALTEIGQQMAHSHRRAAAPPTTPKSGPGPASDLGDSESGIRFQIRPDGGLEPGGLKAGGHSPSSPSQESRRVISEGQTADRPRRTPAAAVASRRGERRATTTTRAAYRLRGSRLRAPVSIDILRVAAVVRWRITAGRGVGPCSTGRVRSAETADGRRPDGRRA